MKTMQERADSVIAGGYLTASKHPSQFIRGVTPTHCIGGDGCYVIAENGDKYLDFIGGLGSSIIDSRNNFCLPTTQEVVLAEKVCELVPCCEKLRFLKTGSEACQAAVRIARAHTKVSGGVGYGYHGWHQWAIAAERPGAGCIDEKYVKYADIDSMTKAMETSGGPAYCIIEPVLLDISDSHRAKVQKLRDWCTVNGTLLVFDEVITGFRVPGYTIANMWGIQPDLICLGKAMANGFPISVVGGKREFMDTPDWFVSSTFAGELSAINAALETIEFLTPGRLADLWERGAKLQKDFNELWPKGIQLVGMPTKMVFQGEDAVKAVYWQEMHKQKVMVGKALHVMWSHNDTKLREFIAKSEIAIQRIKEGQQLTGLAPTDIFRRY